MVTASITFEQNAVSPGAGISMVGVGGLLVTLTNADDTGVISWLWELLDSPISSALVPGTLGTTASETFTPDTAPDTPGCYRVKLTVQGADGSVACDVKNFAVPTTQGWILPPFRASAAELNFPGNTEGWESLLNTIFLGIASGGTDEQVKVTVADTTTGVLDSKLLAGNGLTRTVLNPGANEQYDLNVVANADASIVVNANDVQVGVLATDAQHGVRGGSATQHPDATAVISGFMSAIDKAKLDTLGDIDRRLTVGMGGGVDYTSVKAAMDAAIAGGASTATPWLVEVFPGEYTENPMTLVSGLTVVGQSDRGGSVTITAANPNADLITANGGYLAGVQIQGVTNVANALVRCAGFGSTIFTDVSFSNCSNGLVISGGAVVLADRLSAFISGPGQGIGTAITLTGATSELFLANAAFVVLPPFLALYPGVNPIETCYSISQGTALLTSHNIRVSHNTVTQKALTVDDGAVVSIFASEFSDCETAIEIGSTGVNSKIIVQSCLFQNNTVNANITSATGAVFVTAASDDIKLAAVPGAKLTGIIQTFNGDKTLIAGDTDYVYSSLEQVSIPGYLHDFSMSCVTTGGVVSDGGGLTVDVTAGTGYSATGTPNFTCETVSWAGASGLVLAGSTTNYVYFDGSAGALAVSGASPGVDDILLATVVTSGVGIRYLHTTRNEGERQGDLLNSYLVATRKIAWTSGLAVVQGSTARKLDVNGGSWYRALDLLSVAGGTDVTWSYYYGAGASTEVSGVSDLDITNYDNAGVLTAMTGSYYRADTVIVTSDNRVSIIYGTSEFATQVAAEATTNVASMPNFLDPTGCYVALVVVQQAVGIASIVDIRPDPNAATAGGGGGGGVSVHSALSGLGADDHTQYLRTDGTRALTGSLDVGGNNITNVTNVDGVDVSAHGVRHQPGGADAIATANPVAVGTVNAGGVAASFTRSDHVHAHGAQTVGTLHAVATTLVNGFMSAADKTKLDGLLDSDLAACCVYRSTTQTITTSYVALSCDTEITENDTAVVEHTAIQPTRITVKETGLYFVSFGITVSASGATSEDVLCRVRVSKNGTPITGTEMESGNHYSTGGPWEGLSLSGSFALEATAGDYFEIEIQRDAATNTYTTKAAAAGFTAVRLRGTKGEKGDTGAGSSVSVEDSGVPVAGTPHSTLNFGTGLSVANDGGGQCTITNTFGADYQRQENFAIALTTGEDTVRLTLTTGALTGTYRVGWGCNLIANNKPVEANLYNLTDATVLMSMQPKSADDNPDDDTLAGGTVELVLSGSSKTLQLRYGNIPTKTDNVEIRNAWIEFWRVS